MSTAQRPLRIAYVSHYAQLFGANRALLELVVGLRERHAVLPHVLLPAEGAFADALTAQAVPFSVVPVSMWMHKRTYMGGVHHRLMQVLREERAARARMRMVDQAVPAIVELCRNLEVDLVHSNSSTTISGLLAAQRLQVPHVWHVRELFREHYGYTPDGGERRWRRALRASNAVIAISDVVAASVRAELGRRASIVHRIYDAPFRTSELANWRALAEGHQRTDGTFRFIQVGVFHPSKGQLLSLEAFAEVHRDFPNARLVFVGDGRMDPVKERIAALGLQHVVELKGYVPEAMPLLLDVDCMLNPSQHEAFGRTTVEAMAVGVPVIGLASGATPELIAPDAGGSVFRGGSHAMATLMRQYLVDPAKARAVGRKGMPRVADLFAMEPMLDAVMEVYRPLRTDPLQRR